MPSVLVRRVLYPVSHRGSSLRFPSLVQMFFNKRDDFGERFRIVDSHIRQRFTIEGDLVPFQTSHECAIGESIEARCSVDTHNPELAEIPLACFAIVVRKLPAAFDGLTCPPIQLPSSSTIAL